jgi:hypothetical protein
MALNISSTQTEIGIFAERHNVPVEMAYTLPAIFDKIAEATGRPVRAIISQATYTNVGLADYIKELAEQVS